MASTKSFLVLISLFYACKAFVDTYKYKRGETVDAIGELNNAVAAYYDQKEELLKTYTGDAGETCKAQLAKEEWDGLVHTLFQTAMIGNVGEIKKIDTDWSNANTECGEDKECQQAVTKEWSFKLEEFKITAEGQIYKIEKTYLHKIQRYMNNCTENFVESQHQF